MKITRLLAAATLVLAGGFPISSPAEPEASLFPFYLPGDDVTEGVTDLSFLNTRPANDFVTAKDGHFFAGDSRIRFWGVCIIGLEAFPSHEDAELLARRLASRGFNQARIHLIDGSYAPHGLFDPDHKGELRILPERLDKLDYFIAELKKRGIYVELSIHGYHWRNVSGSAEYPDFDLKKLAPFSSGVPLWNEHFIGVEKQFARDFFAHVNPYTGLAYTVEPAVSTLEVINENGVISAWRGGHFSLWPEGMQADLRGHWNKFLAARYATTEKLRQAWAEGEIHPDKVNMLKNGDFADGSKTWGLQAAKPSVATMDVATQDGPADKPGVTIKADRSAEKLAFVNLNQTGLTIEKGVRYRLTFWARADVSVGAPAKVSVSISMSHAPWSTLGLSASAELDGQWQKKTFFFVGAQDDSVAKVMLEAPVGASQLHFADFSLGKADVNGLLPNESLEAPSVSMPMAPQESVDRTHQVTADFADFLFKIDADYFDTMRNFLVNELHTRHPIKGTQVDQYSSYFSQARYDYLDSHGYWQHPSWPHKQWDREDWLIPNSPMVNAGEQVLVQLAERRVDGKPFNVSEYCHPAPSTYCAEQIPAISAVGALQDWDGIVFHCWQEMTYDYAKRESRRLPAERLDSMWFNMARHPVKLVTLPFGTLAYRRGDVAVAREETSIGVTPEAEKQWLTGDMSKSFRAFDVAGRAGATWRDVLTHRIGLALDSKAAPQFLPADSPRAKSDTGELTYDLSDANAGVLVVNTSRSKAVIGYGAGKTFELGDITLQPGPTMQNGYSVITASAVQGESLHAKGARLLITATGYIENKGMGWNADKTSVGKQWGEGPAMCEGIPFDLTLKASHATAWPLDGRGRRLAPMIGETVSNGVRFHFGPGSRTLWYEIAVE